MVHISDETRGAGFSAESRRDDDGGGVYNHKAFTRRITSAFIRNGLFRPHRKYRLLFQSDLESSGVPVYLWRSRWWQQDLVSRNAGVVQGESGALGVEVPGGRGSRLDVWGHAVTCN